MFELEAGAVVRNPTVAFHTAEIEDGSTESWLELHDENGDGAVILCFSLPENMKFMSEMFNAAAAELSVCQERGLGTAVHHSELIM